MVLAKQCGEMALPASGIENRRGIRGCNKGDEVALECLDVQAIQRVAGRVAREIGRRV